MVQLRHLTEEYRNFLVESWSDSGAENTTPEYEDDPTYYNLCPATRQGSIFYG